MMSARLTMVCTGLLPVGKAEVTPSTIGAHDAYPFFAGPHMEEMTLGGLFSGVGGFELAWQRNGGRVAWMCEIDPKARQVLEARFPGVPIYEDVTQLDPHKVEPVDVLTGGSPCQGFSIAGGRKGLEHHESRLFADHIRIMDGLAERGLRWAVWENVPGVLSISNEDGGRTFPHVVAALVGAGEPVQLDGRTRWNTGLADGGSRAVAWRVLDSRHFGVPQRRRRVYACVAFGDSAADRAGRALLAVPEGVSGHPAACQQAQEAATGTPRKGTAGSGRDHRTSGGVAAVQSTAGTLGGGSGNRGWAADTDRMTFVPDTARTLKARADSSYTADGHGNDAIDQQLVPDAAQCVTTGTGMRYDPETETLAPDIAQASQGGGDNPGALASKEAVAYQRQGSNVGEVGTLRSGNGGITGGVPFLADVPSADVGHDRREPDVATSERAFVPDVAHTLRAEGHDASEDGTGRGTPLVSQSFNWQQGNAEYTLAGDAHTLGTTSQPAVMMPVPIQNAATRTDSSAKTPSPDAKGHVRLRDPGLGVGEPGDPQYTLDATHPHAVGPVPVQPVPIDMMRQSVSHNHPNGAGTPGTGIGEPGGPAYGLNAQRAVQAVGPVPKGVAENQRGEQVTTDYAHAVTSGGGKPGQGYPAVMEPYSFEMKGREGGAVPEVAQPGAINALRAGDGGSSRSRYIGTQYGVRRLTPLECERLQAFPPVLEWNIDEMTRDELCAAVLAAGYAIVEPDSGRCWRTRGPDGHTLAEPNELKGFNVNGHLVASLKFGDVKKRVRLHQLVWIAAHGAPERGTTVNHINGDRTDNRVANLELVTAAENTQNAESSLSRTGTDNPACESGPEVWQQVCEDYQQPARIIYTLAEKYGMSRSRIQQIVTEHGWTEPAGSDSARYKALGNAVTVSVPQWLFGRMLQVDS